MPLDSPSDSREEMEATFKSWFQQFEDAWWLDPDAMPDGAHEAMQAYLDAVTKKGYSKSLTQAADEVMATAKQKFREATGHDIGDFFAFRLQLNETESKL